MLCSWLLRSDEWMPLYRDWCDGRSFNALLKDPRPSGCVQYITVFFFWSDMRLESSYTYAAARPKLVAYFIFVVKSTHCSRFSANGKRTLKNLVVSHFSYSKQRRTWVQRWWRIGIQNRGTPKSSIFMAFSRFSCVNHGHGNPQIETIGMSNFFTIQGTLFYEAPAVVLLQTQQGHALGGLSTWHWHVWTRGCGWKGIIAHTCGMPHNGYFMLFW